MNSNAVLYGVDPTTGNIYPIMIDASGHLQIDITAIPTASVNIYGLDGVTWRGVTVDASGHLQIDALTLPAITIAAGQTVDGRVYGYYNGAWYKNPLQFGVSDVLVDKAAFHAVAAGDQWVTGTTVPAGQLWVITSWSMAKDGTTTSLQAGFYDGVDNRIWWGQYTMTNNVYYDRQGWWVLAPGMQPRVLAKGTAINDWIYWVASGYKMSLTS